jgi:hypothetical protein
MILNCSMQAAFGSLNVQLDKYREQFLTVS